MYLIGYIVKPQGIKGEVKVQPETPNPGRFKKLKQVFIRNESGTQKLSIRSVRFDDRFVYLGFLEVQDRDQAELLRSSEILIEAADLIKPNKGEYFVHDLVGCRVFDEKNTLIGEITDVVQMSSSDIYVVRTEDGDEKLIPAIREVIREVDTENKRVDIHVMEGLLD
jgi:16S rRNA processing protein RimM